MARLNYSRSEDEKSEVSDIRALGEKDKLIIIFDEPICGKRAKIREIIERFLEDNEKRVIIGSGCKVFIIEGGKKTPMVKILNKKLKEIGNE